VRVFVGSYPTAPPGSPELVPLAAELADEPLVAGFEVPWVGSERTGAAVRAAARIQPSWEFALTAIPWTMSTLGETPTVGLASPDDDGRALAVAEHTAMLEVARGVDDHLGRRVVVAVQVHSAPRGGTSDALARSLEQLEAVAGDTPILLEHADAPVPGRLAAKGFLSLEAEAAVLADRGPRFGIALNWARSAIELRDPDRVVEHVTAARATGRLRLLVFSGVSDRVTAYGPAWADAHLPVEGPHEPHSMLTERLAHAAIAAAGPDVLFGVKLAHRERDGGVPSTTDTVRMLRSAVAVVAGAGREGYR
jgi:hypothetical protein